MGWKEEESKSSKICFAIVKSALEIPGEITWKRYQFFVIILINYSKAKDEN